MHIENLEDGGEKLSAKEGSVNVTNDEQATNNELEDILLEDHGGDKEESKEVEAEVEKDDDEESTEVKEDETEVEGSDALLCPIGKRKET